MIGFNECVLTLAGFVVDRGKAGFNMVTSAETTISNMAGNIFNQIGHARQYGLSGG